MVMACFDHANKLTASFLYVLVALLLTVHVTLFPFCNSHCSG